MNPIEVDEVLDRLCGEFEYEMGDDERQLWVDSIKVFDKDQCVEAIEALTHDHMNLPTIATFRMAAIKAGQKARPKERCGCLDGWEIPTEDNYVVACRRCTAGNIKASCVEQYRSERADWRRKHRTPERLTEKPAEHGDEWAAQARDWLANGMPEREPVPTDYYERDEEF